jgi:hypothetical protein
MFLEVAGLGSRGRGSMISLRLQVNVYVSDLWGFEEMR